MPSPQPQIESASMLTAPHLITIMQAEIHQLFQGKSMYKHNFLSNFEGTKCCGYLVEYHRSGSSKSNLLFSVSKQCIYASFVATIHWFRRQTQKRLILLFLRVMTIENYVKVTEIISTFYSATMTQYWSFGFPSSGLLHLAFLLIAAEGLVVVWMGISIRAFPCFLSQVNDGATLIFCFFCF